MRAYRSKRGGAWRFISQAITCGVLLGATAASVAAADNPAPPAQPQQRDAAAGKFMMTCAGCHSLAGAKLNGPDLSHVVAWPEAQLKTAIKRMTPRVGPLGDADVDTLADLLRAPDVRARLKAEEARIQAMFMAKLEPANAAIGKMLFFGKTELQNGGLACAACHAAAGEGGNLGPDLASAFSRIGETPLVSGIEKAGYKVMEPHYRWRPITKQEAVHITKYLSTLDPKTAPAGRSAFAQVGAGGAMAAMIGLVLYLKNGRKGREMKLQRRRK
jgi:mono/diheme cytochrome c family protein